jgi:hypothetical protein
MLPPEFELPNVQMVIGINLFFYNLLSLWCKVTARENRLRQYTFKFALYFGNTETVTSNFSTVGSLRNLEDFNGQVTLHR